MPFPNALRSVNKHVTNRLTVHLVGHGSFAEVEHVGRRSGRTYRNPVNAFRDGDRVTFALTYGPRVDWLRNVRAAGGCRLRLGGQVLTLGAPVDLDPAEGLRRMPAPARVVLRLASVDGFVEMPVLREDPAG
ncbi:nitroreductase family deazaflavin-dependent oxidoreductase [Arthrobacter sp. NEB 688]|uniref:nitroreductase family deazaflavin-dependent oxidoreductase n=1 Tax=Arthrobacter sp. NEB 688 TaxID=904039 RepID=UPI0015650983|nr:nitroreductase family deazaflavin-dependent oxidoreductase [Arthrobacter sp. NEB 688]QKE84749.1 nitroreductase family deazaflavin-dependent oxidoreductase [Arthrobacter sp. NEB 688]